MNDAIYGPPIVNFGSNILKMKMLGLVPINRVGKKELEFYELR